MNVTRMAAALLFPLLAAGPVSAQTAIPSPVPSATATASPTPGVGATYTPPAGWASKDMSLGIGGAHMVSLWVSPDVVETAASMNLMAEDLRGHTAAQYITNTQAQLARIYGAGSIKVFRPQKLCNGSIEGWYVESEVAFGSRNMVSEQVIAVGSSQAYILSYGRLVGEPEDPAAHSALLSLCLTS